jgi:hypothetical protein
MYLKSIAYLLAALIFRYLPAFGSIDRKAVGEIPLKYALRPNRFMRFELDVATDQFLGYRQIRKV